MTTSTRNPRVRNWCFTLFGYTGATMDRLEQLHHEESSWVVYGVFQEEECPETHRFHLQGYLQFNRAVRRSRVKRNCFSAEEQGVHLEPALGSGNKNKAYCTKTDTRKAGAVPREFGQMKGTTRATLEDSVRKGCTMQQLAEAFPKKVMRHHGGIQVLRALFTQPRRHAPEVVVYYGPTGTGKTMTALHSWPEAYVVPWPGKNGMWWWNGYDGQETVVLDEFRHQVPYDEVLRLFDRYPYKVQTKGG